MAEKKEVQTEISTVELELDDILSQPGAESIMLPGEKKEGAKPGIFSNLTPDTSFLDKFKKDPDPDPDPQKPDDVNPDDVNPDDINPDDPDDPDNLLKDDKKKGGRSTSLVSVTKKLVEKGVLVPFDDDKKLEDYTEEDVEELLEENYKQIKIDLQKTVAGELYESMPEELQQVYEYVANGGQDVRGFMRALTASQEIQEVDISSEAGQRYAIRTYLQATRWGTSEEIEEELNSLADKGELEKKAKQFKPKLDALSQEIIESQLEEQKQQKRLRDAQSQKYIESVYTTLEKGELAGVKLDTRTQNLLYAGLVQANYPSASGRQTNLLGHLLEKYQWKEPRHDLIAEALWLLADPDNYRKTIAENATKEKTKETLRTLKTQQEKISGNGTNQDDPDEGSQRKSRVLNRPKKNFFTRE